MDFSIAPASSLALGAAGASPSMRPDARAPAADFAASLAPAIAVRAEPPAPEAFRRFEAMVLSQFVEAMLPKDADAAYGGGLAGDMWRGLAAEKIADEMAKRGGVGIARHLLDGHYAAQDLAQAETTQEAPSGR